MSVKPGVAAAPGGPTGRASDAPIARHAITGAILAGGRATRMGGREKGLVPLHGQPLITHVIERLRPQVGQLILNVNRPEAYAHLDLPTVADGGPGGRGPLAGLAAALAVCPTEWLLSAPCDTPFLPADLAHALARVVHAEGRRAAVASTGGCWEPLFALIHRSLLPTLEGYLAAGRRKARDWLLAANAVEVPFADAAAFRNFNTLEALTALERPARSVTC